jgi:GDP-D-mannose dehydratase
VDPLYNDPDLRLHYGDVCDGQALSRLVAQVRPDELYNLAAMSHVAVSFEVPESAADSAGLGCLRCLEAGARRGARGEAAASTRRSSSEMFGPAPELTADRAGPVPPALPVRVREAVRALDGRDVSSKAREREIETAANPRALRRYRDSYGMHATSGILYEPRP